jgi:hypothetical protein
MARRLLAALMVGATFTALAYGQAAPVGAYQSVVICLPANAASGAQQVVVSGHSLSCGTDANGNALMGYAESWQLLPPSSSGSGFASVDAQQTAEFWAGAFSSVLLLYFVGAGIGAVLDLVRRG